MKILFDRGSAPDPTVYQQQLIGVIPLPHFLPLPVPFQFLPCLPLLQLSPIIPLHSLLPRSPPLNQLWHG